MRLTLVGLRRGGVPAAVKQTGGLLLGEMPGSLWIPPNGSASRSQTHLLLIRLCLCGSDGGFRFLASFKTDLVRNNN